MQRVAIVGHTGRGNYGHYLDMAFAGGKYSVYRWG